MGLNLWRIKIPNIAGNTVTKAMCDMVVKTGNENDVVLPKKYCNETFTNTGIVNIQSKALSTVSEILKATLPFKIKLTKLDVTPPGQKESIIKPTLMAGEKLLKYIKTNAAIGNKTICATSPIVMDFGAVNKFLKSSLLSPKPKLIVINASTKSIKKSV